MLNIIKAQYTLKDKGETIKKIVSEYIDFKDKPELREYFVQEMYTLKSKKVQT